MNCPKCGTQLAEGSSFCGTCGNRLGTAGAPPSPQQPSYSGAGGIHIDEDSRGQGRGYNYEVLHQPSFSLAVIKLQAEQSIQAEAGAMVSMSANVELQSEMKGGLFGAIKRAAGGESAFVSTFTARGGTGRGYLCSWRSGRHSRDRVKQPIFLRSIKLLPGR